MITDWINAINTTSLRIVASLAIALLGVPMVLLAMLWAGWSPNGEQLKVLIGLAGFVLTMMGFDVAQFIGKRFSDAEYVTAKKGPSPVTVEAPSTVSVTTTAPAPRVAPAAEEVAASSAPASPVAREALATAVAAAHADPSVPVGAHVAGEGD